MATPAHNEVQDRTYVQFPNVPTGDNDSLGEITVLEREVEMALGLTLAGTITASGESFAS